MPDVEEPVGEPGLEGQQAGRPGHGRGDGHDPGIGLGVAQQRPGEGVGVGGHRQVAATADRPPSRQPVRRGHGAGSGAVHRHRRAGTRASGRHLDVVQALDVVLLGRRVAPALLGEHVDHDRARPLGGVGQRLLQAGDVVAVDRADVADAQGLEEGVGCDHLAQGAGQAVHARVGQVADAGQFADQVRGCAGGPGRRPG